MKLNYQHKEVVLTSLISSLSFFFAILFLFSGAAHAQQTPAISDSASGLRDALYVCLKSKVPDVERTVFDNGTAHDPTSGRNFHYDNTIHAWIDSKTGECICPKCTPGATDSATGKRDALYVCLKSKIPGVERTVFDNSSAHDPTSGRNFHYDNNIHAWIDSKTGECICPKCPPQTTTPPLKDTTNTSTPPAFKIGNFGFAAASAGANYSFGSSYDQYGVNAGLLSSPCPGGSQFEFDAGFHPYSNNYTYSYMDQSYSYSENGSILDLNAIYFWNQCNWRFGPTAGYHLDSWSYSDDASTSYNSHTFNIGGYGQLLPQNNFTGSAKAGYVFSDNNGYYAGFDIGYYFCPEFDLCGGFDYTDYDAYKVYSLRGEYQISQTTPFAVSAGYDLSAYPNSSTTGRVSLGLKYNWNIPTSTTMEDRNITGLLSNYQFRY